MTENQEPLSEAEIEELANFLTQFGNDDSVLDVSELDGFFTAILSGPDAVMPNEWYPEIWGGPGNEPELDTLEEVEALMTLLMRHLTSISLQLEDNPEFFEPLFNERKEDDSDVIHTVVEEWCYGYVRGVNMRTKQWAKLPEDQGNMLSVVYLFGSEEFFPELEKLTEETVLKLQRQLGIVAAELYGFWAEDRAGNPRKSQPFMRDTSKIGRNELCPCKSGKKYKKCCGLN